MQFLLLIWVVPLCCALGIKGNYQRFPAKSDVEESAVIEMNDVNYLDERIIALISDYMDLDSFNALRESCTVYKKSCDEYSNLLIEANYFSLLQRARKHNLKFAVSNIAQIKWIDKHPVNITNLHSLFKSRPQWIYRGIRLPEKLPFIVFSLFNQQNLNQKLYIAATFNRTRLQSLTYQIRVHDKLQPLQNAKLFRDQSDNLDIIIDLVNNQKISSIFEFCDVSWIAKKTYFSRFATVWLSSKYIKSLIQCYQANEMRIKIGFICYSVYYLFWIFFMLIK